MLKAVWSRERTAVEAHTCLLADKYELSLWHLGLQAILNIWAFARWPLT